MAFSVQPLRAWLTVPITVDLLPQLAHICNTEDICKMEGKTIRNIQSTQQNLLASKHFPPFPMLLISCPSSQTSVRWKAKWSETIYNIHCKIYSPPDISHHSHYCIFPVHAHKHLYNGGWSDQKHAVYTAKPTCPQTLLITLITAYFLHRARWSETTLQDLLISRHSPPF